MGLLQQQKNRIIKKGGTQSLDDQLPSYAWQQSGGCSEGHFVSTIAILHSITYLSYAQMISTYLHPPHQLRLEIYTYTIST